MIVTLILVLTCLGYRFLSRHRSVLHSRGAAAGALGLVFLFTASGHFLWTASMVQMLPPWLPEREALVHATGVLEIAIALALFFRRSRDAGAWAAAAALVAFFPASVYAAFQHVPFGGHAWGPVYLLLRTALQLLLLWWTWALVLGRPGKAPAPAGLQ